MEQDKKITEQNIVIIGKNAKKALEIINKNKSEKKMENKKNG